MTMDTRGARLESTHGGPPPETLLKQEMEKARKRRISGRVSIEVIYRNGTVKGTTTSVETNRLPPTQPQGEGDE